MDSRQQQFTTIFFQSQHRVFGYVVTLVPNRADAEEVFQQVCLILWEKWDEYDPDREFVPWACGIAWNIVQNFRRKRKPIDQLFDDELLTQVAETYTRHEVLLEARRRALPDCLAKLPAEQRDLVERCYLSGEPIVAAAKQLGLSAAAVTMRLRRIRKLLFDCLTRAVAGEARA